MFIALGKKNSGTKMSQCRKCLGCLTLLLYKKAEKKRLRRSKNISGPDLSKHFWARLVSGMDMSRGRTCLGARLVSRQDLSQGQTCPKTSGSEVSKSLGLEVSCGRTWSAAVSVSELSKFLGYIRSL